MKTKEIIAFREAKKSSSLFLFTKGHSASKRKYNELKNSFDVKAKFEEHEIHVISSWTESFQNIYFNFSVYVDGIKKDLRVLRKLPSELEFK
jgi:hypothetical protein